MTTALKIRAGIRFLPPATLRVYRAISVAAEQGRPAPSVTMLADAAGKSPSGALSHLARAGMVRTERRSSNSLERRRYLDVASRRWTGWLVIRDTRRHHGEAPARPPSTEALLLLAMLRGLAERAAPLPPTRTLAEAIGVKADNLPHLMRALRVRGLAKTETGPDRCTRRAWVADVDRWTGWTERVVPVVPSVAEPAERPPPVTIGGYAGRRYEDDPRFAEMGRTGRPIMGRVASGFIPREASC